MNLPFGVQKEFVVFVNGDPPVCIDLEKRVAIRLNEVCLQIMRRYGGCSFHDLLTEMRMRHSWWEIQAALNRLTELAELGLIFTDGYVRRNKERPSFLVSPGFVKNRYRRGILPSIACHTLLRRLAQEADLAAYVGLDEGEDVTEALSVVAPGLHIMRFAPILSYAANAQIPLECDGVLMFTPLHGVDLQFLVDRQWRLVLYIANYGRDTSFESMSVVYATHRPGDVWLFPQFWLEKELRQAFPGVEQLYALPIDVEWNLVAEIPSTRAVKDWLREVLGVGGALSNTMVGVYGVCSEWLTRELAEGDQTRTYIRIASDEHRSEAYHTYTLDGRAQDVESLLRLLRGLDLLVFIAQGPVEPYLLYGSGAVGTPVLLVGCESLPPGLLCGPVHHQATLDCRAIREWIARNVAPVDEDMVRETPETNPCPVSMDRGGVEFLRRWGGCRKDAWGPIRAPRPPSCVFTQHYDPAQGGVTARALSFDPVVEVSLKNSVVSELLLYHSETEVDIVLSHFGKGATEV